MKTRFCCAALAILFLSGCDEQVLHNLSETDANRVITALADSSISATKIKQPDGDWAIAVASKDTVSAIRTLQSRRVVPEAVESPASEGGVMSSREDQRARFASKQASDVERTLLSLTGVLESHVHINLPQREQLFGQQIDYSKGTASVLLVIEPRTVINQSDVSALVSGATGIAPSAISVITSLGEATRGDLELAEPVTTTETVASQQWGLWQHGTGQRLAGVALLLCGIVLVCLGIRYRSSALIAQNSQRGAI